MKEIQKLFKSYRVNKYLRPAAAAYRYKNIKSPPVYRGDLTRGHWTLASKRQFVYMNVNKGNLRDLTAASGLVILLKLDSNRQI